MPDGVVSDLLWWFRDTIGNAIFATTVFILTQYLVWERVTVCGWMEESSGKN